MAVLSTGVLWAIPARWKLRPLIFRRRASAPAELSTETQPAGQENTVRDCHDTWRTLAQKHTKDLAEANKRLKDREDIISELKKGNGSLKNQRDTSEARNADLASCLNEVTTNLDKANKMLDEATTKRDRLASQLHEAKANMTKLRRSDRTKEKTQQQNIHLKALLHRQSVKYNTTKYSTAATFRGVTAALNQNILQSALSAAIERIDELEARGQALLDALLDALEEQGTSSEEEEGEGEGEEEYDDSEAVAKLLKAQVKLDGVLRDKGFTLERRTWRHLLRD